MNTDAIRAAQGPSGITLVTTDSTGENAITTIASANARLACEDLNANITLIRSAAILLTQLEIPLKTVEYLASIAMKENIPLMLDPAPAQRLSPSLLKCVDWLTPSETETCSLRGYQAQELREEELEDAAAMLLEFGCKNVILKLSGRGCYLALADHTRLLLRAYPVRPVDTAAVGDAFNGALAGALVDGKNPIDSASWAFAAAAVSVTRLGAQASLPTP